jgi:2-hydroxy-6-oxonona-2,4-dienedioate hydrolase
VGRRDKTEDVGKDLERFRVAERLVWERLGVTPVDRRIPLASGGEVRVQELGEGRPVVFIHGGSIAGTCWADLAASLHDVRCILVDRPGCGLSDPIAGGPWRDLESVQRYADRLLTDLLDALELERSVVAATSYGGFFALRGAAATPDRVEQLIEYSWLVGAPAAAAPFTARLAAVPGMQALITRIPMTRGMVRGALRQFGLGRAIDSGAFDDTMLDWAHALLRHTNTMRNDVRSSPQVITPIRGQNPDVLLTDELLSRVTMPTLFLWGPAQRSSYLSRPPSIRTPVTSPITSAGDTVLGAASKAVAVHSGASSNVILGSSRPQPARLMLISVGLASMSNTAEYLAPPASSMSICSSSQSASMSNSMSTLLKPLRTSGSTPSTPRTSMSALTVEDTLVSGMLRAAAPVAMPAVMHAASAWRTYSCGVGPCPWPRVGWSARNVNRSTWVWSPPIPYHS